MKIGLDIMGGDYAPQATVQGAIAAVNELNADDQIVLIGDESAAAKIIKEAGLSNHPFEIVHTSDVIGMGEHPTKAIMQKPNSSIGVGFRMLKEKQIDAFASAGNTGAMLVGAMFSVKSIPGVIRPAITAIVPKVKGGSAIMLDVGANADCKPDVLFQFGILGSVFAEAVYQIDKPKVALMNIGEEEEKGNMLSVATYPLMKNTGAFNFIGNIEGRDLFNDKADVIVCDGFTGNVMLKLAESFYVMNLKKGYHDKFFDRMNYENYGGSPILGINEPVIIGHGISNAKAIKNMILLARNVVDTKLINKIKNAFSTN